MTEPAAPTKGVSFDVASNDDVIRGKLLELADRVGSLDEVLDEIGASQVTEVQHRFETARGPDGTAWKRLADATLKRHPAGSGARILRRGGDLYASITHAVADGSVRIGTNKTYARIHQLGGQAGRGHKVTIDARPFLGFSEEGKREVLAIIEDHLAIGGPS